MDNQYRILNSGRELLIKSNIIGNNNNQILVDDLISPNYYLIIQAEKEENYLMIERFDLLNGKKESLEILIPFPKKYFVNDYSFHNFVSSNISNDEVVIITKHIHNDNREYIHICIHLNLQNLEYNIIDLRLNNPFSPEYDFLIQLSDNILYILCKKRYFSDQEIYIDDTDTDDIETIFNLYSYNLEGNGNAQLILKSHSDLILENMFITSLGIMYSGYKRMYNDNKKIELRSLSGETLHIGKFVFIYPDHIIFPNGKLSELKNLANDRRIPIELVWENLDSAEYFYPSGYIENNVLSLWSDTDIMKGEKPDEDEEEEEGGMLIYKIYEYTMKINQRPKRANNY